jgi:hypothetical protein
VLHDHQRALGELPAQRFVDPDILDRAVMREPVGYFAGSCDLVRFDDLPHLCAQLMRTCLCFLFGSQCAVAFGAFGLQLLRIDTFVVIGDWRLALALLVLFAHRGGNFVLFGQAGFQQLFLQRIAHGRIGLAGRRAPL